MEETNLKLLLFDYMGVDVDPKPTLKFDLLYACCEHVLKDTRTKEEILERVTKRCSPTKRLDATFIERDPTLAMEMSEDADDIDQIKKEQKTLAAERTLFEKKATDHQERC